MRQPMEVLSSAFVDHTQFADEANAPVTEA
jgi:hypothetical protein